MLGLCLMLTACTSIHSESETRPVIVNNPSPADTAAPKPAEPDSENTSKSIPETKKEKTKNPWPPIPEGVTVIEASETAEGLERHRVNLQQKSDIALLPTEVGYYVDNMQARFIQKLRIPGVTLTRQADVLTIKIAGVQTFETNSYRLKADIKETLAPLAEVLDEYEKTSIQIDGHTDDSGPEEYNQKLSEQRALSLSRILIEAGVKPRRIAVIGFGELQPLQPNKNEAARLANRRLELRIEPVIASGN